jgi:uncharacterized protein (DUF697 family)
MFVGGAINAMAASALIYAIGRAACVYLGEVRKGQVVSPEEIRRVFKGALDDAFVRSPEKPRRTRPEHSET